MKKLLILLSIVIIPFFVSGQTTPWWGVQEGTAGGGVQYTNSGIINYTTTATHTAYYPDIVNSGDILILQVIDKYFQSTINTPSGWNLIDYTTGIRRYGFYWKRADGTEGGTTLSISISGSSRFTFSTISAFSGCVSTGTPYEDLTIVPSSGISTSASIDSPVLTSSGSGRLAVVCISRNDDDLLTSWGGTWDSKWENYSSSGTDAAFLGADYPTDSGIASQTITFAASDENKLIAFLLIPE